MNKKLIDLSYRMLDCPFCGSRPILKDDPGMGGHGSYPPTAYGFCPKCYARGPIVGAHQANVYVDVAFDLWNERVPPSCTHPSVKGGDDDV